MPLVRIDIIKGHTDDYKKTFLSAVHDGLEAALGIPGWDRYQRLFEIENDYFERGDNYSENFCIIELTIFPGRSKEVKARILKEITRLLAERLSIAPSDIFIVINDPPLENWGFGGMQKGS
jgi:phenylpyruvate tautomerase PptA (4-oxalocrotonate tautomerase family)